MIEIEEIKKETSRYCKVNTYTNNNKLISTRTVHYTLKSVLYNEEQNHTIKSLQDELNAMKKLYSGTNSNLN